MTKEVMKQALKALETAWYHVGTFAPTDDAIELYDKARTSLRQAIAEVEKQEQGEPVAWMDKITFDNDQIIKAIVRRKQDEQHNIPLYTKSQTKEWVSLTKMELVKIGVFPFGKSYELYEAVDAKLKEKNA